MEIKTNNDSNSVTFHCLDSSLQMKYCTAWNCESMAPYINSNIALNEETPELINMIGKYFTFNIKTCIKSTDDGKKTIFHNVSNIIENNM